jgi:hypothetical protein
MKVTMMIMAKVGGERRDEKSEVMRGRGDREGKRKRREGKAKRVSNGRDTRLIKSSGLTNKSLVKKTKQETRRSLLPTLFVCQ